MFKDYWTLWKQDGAYAQYFILIYLYFEGNGRKMNTVEALVRVGRIQGLKLQFGRRIPLILFRTDFLFKDLKNIMLNISLS